MSKKRKELRPTQAIDTWGDQTLPKTEKSEEEIVLEVMDRTAARWRPGEWMGDSTYWGKGKGAFHYQGEWVDPSGTLHKAVLKVQLAEPIVSEKDMIESFSKQNDSKIISAPPVWFHLPWSEERGYEAIIMAEATGPKVLPSGELLQPEQIQRFFAYYSEYRTHCLHEPWLSQPSITLVEAVALKRENLLEARQKHSPNSSLRHPGDLELAEAGWARLEELWQDVPWQWQQGHFSVEDLAYEKPLDPQMKDTLPPVMIFSNLFWRWSQPFYDAVFGYHWWRYTLARVEGITPAQIEEQLQYWQQELQKLVKTENDQRLLDAALIERAIAGILLDGIVYAEEENTIWQALMEQTRRELRRLLAERGTD